MIALNITTPLLHLFAEDHIERVLMGVQGTSRNKGGEEQRKAERRGTLLFSFMPDLVIYIGIYRILANRIGLDYLQEYSALTEFNILH